jgi:phosphoenolpyruvate synthase/pyruvate phosphate dikinase
VKVHVFTKGKLNPDIDYKNMKNLLGGKGAYLASMMSLGLPVPPGFTITTEVCTYYYKNKKAYPKTLDAEAKLALLKMEKITGKKVKNYNIDLTNAQAAATIFTENPNITGVIHFAAYKAVGESVETFDAMLRTDFDKMSKLIKQAGISAE